jgi:hypothetical protein
MATATVHCFEAAGLGKAPFSYDGVIHQEMAYGERVLGSVGGCTMTTKAGGTCDYCGTYIVNMFRVRSSDGNTFKVGCDCIRKTGDEGLIRRVEKDVKAANKKRRDERKMTKLIAAKEYCLATIPSHRGTLASLPHPSPTLAGLGRTGLDYANWMAEMKHYESLATFLRRSL